MQGVARKHCCLLIAIVVLIGTMFTAVPSYGQGRGHGYGRYKKADRFINGHDARNGRWDGRGPRTRIRRIYGYNGSYYRDRRWRRHHYYRGSRTYNIYRNRRYYR